MPTAPWSLAAVNATDTSVTLSWMEPNITNGIITRYQVEYRVISTDQTSIVLQNTTSLTYMVTGLSAYTEYSFRVAAATRTGLGPYTEFVSTLTTGKFPRNSLH